MKRVHLPETSTAPDETATQQLPEASPSISSQGGAVVGKKRRKSSGAASTSSDAMEGTSAERNKSHIVGHIKQVKEGMTR